eukprot:3143534-Amphidinium_carterae.1
MSTPQSRFDILSRSFSWMTIAPYPQDNVIMITENLSMLPTDEVLTTSVLLTTAFIFALHPSGIGANNTFTFVRTTRTQGIVTVLGNCRLVTRTPEGLYSFGVSISIQPHAMIPAP